MRQRANEEPGYLDGLEAFTPEQRPDLEERARNLEPDAFPEFMHHDAAVNRHWSSLYERFAGFQVVVCQGSEVVAAGNTIPVSLEPWRSCRRG
jgi:hypothetical protein